MAEKHSILLLSCLALLIAMIYQSANAGSADSTGDEFAAVDSYVKGQMEAVGIPGIDLGIVQGNQVVHRIGGALVILFQVGGLVRGLNRRRRGLPIHAWQVVATVLLNLTVSFMFIFILPGNIVPFHLPPMLALYPELAWELILGAVMGVGWGFAYSLLYFAGVNEQPIRINQKIPQKIPSYDPVKSPPAPHARVGILVYA